MKNNVLFIAPHADDEILGCGATIYKMIQEGHNVYVLIMTNASKSDPNIFSEKGIQRVRTEALEAHRLLGVKQTFFFDFPAIPHLSVSLPMDYRNFSYPSPLILL